MEYKDKLNAIRVAMLNSKIDAYIIPSTDPHLSEYVADHWLARAWLTGFDGSAGTVVITQDFAGVWTDSRYFLQAEVQLKNSGFELCKLKIPHTPEHLSWVIENLQPNQTIGIDGELFAVSDVKKMQGLFGGSNIGLDTTCDFISDIWEDRPGLPVGAVFEHSSEYTGESKAKKIGKIQDFIKYYHANLYVTNILDEIAWLLNLRGSDIEFNPVFVAYLVVSTEKTYLFIEASKVPKEIRVVLEHENVVLLPYEDIADFLANIEPRKKVLYSATLNYKLFNTIAEQADKKLVESIITNLKSRKNKSEQAHIKRAMAKDGVALTRFFMWLENSIGKEKITEVSAADKLLGFRKQQPLFMGESFETIAGYADHGAIVHYSAKTDSAHELGTDALFLLDSGGQYLDGTTDITRTVHLGEPSVAEKQDFTLVLKGHIAMASAIFPEGTNGAHIDTLARLALWQKHKNYGHGTGHGVGFFLNVHEGPQRVSPTGFGVSLQEGMVISNEPGFYLPEKYGIRIENLVLVKKSGENEFGNFLEFETVTLFPIEQKLIDFTILTDDEIKWLDKYHKKVFEQLSPMLNNDEKAWLANKTKPYKCF